VTGASRKRNVGRMAVWLVAEDRVQIVRADSVVTYAVATVKPSGIASADPVARLPNGWVRILAGTHATRDPDSHWAVLLTFQSDGGEAAVKVLHELAVTVGKADEQARADGKSALFVHGPLPRLDNDPLREPVWRISEELPVKGWPTSGSFWRDPLP
jgi:hypothetical protein